MKSSRTGENPGTNSSLKIKRKSNKTKPLQSFVIRKEPRKGIRLIKITIQDLIEEASSSPQTADSDSVVLNAQYVVKDAVDDIFDQTENIVNKISKKLSSDDIFYNF
uniref:Uncharacterized protein n=1 Tax=Pectinophora gossypiella TaxID=13191 RepID=A0A1E1WJ05_PECGO